MTTSEHVNNQFNQLHEEIADLKRLLEQVLRLSIPSEKEDVTRRLQQLSGIRDAVFVEDAREMVKKARHDALYEAAALAEGHGAHLVAYAIRVLRDNK